MLVKCRDMQGNGFRGIIIGIILVVLCFVVGAQAADSAVSSLAIVVAICGLFGMLVFGSKSWMLIFLLPPLLELLPLPPSIARIPKEFYAAGLVLAYWIVLWGMGHVKMRWRALGLMDLIVLLLSCIMVAAYIRRPVAVMFLGMENDNIGGYEYVQFVMGLICYIAFSVIPMPLKQLTRVLNISVIVKLCVTFVLLILVVTGVRGAAVDVAEAVSSSGGRLYGIHRYGSPFCIAIFSYFSLRSILINPILMLGSAFSVVVVLLAGSRNYFGTMALTVGALCVIKRETLIAMCIGAFAYIMLLVFSLGGALNDLPVSVQRICAMLPGVQVSSHAQKDGNTTWEWREELWELAWDKRTGYIKDYVFGDGYGQSLSSMERRHRSLMRGDYVYGQDLDEFAVAGQWHHGVITAIHRIGYVGLSVVVSLIVVSLYYLFVVCAAWRGSTLFKPLMFYVVSISVLPLTFVWGGSAELSLHFAQFAIIKMAYCMAREQGRLKPLFQRHKYQPLMIQEYGDRVHAPQGW